MLERSRQPERSWGLAFLALAVAGGAGFALPSARPEDPSSASAPLAIACDQGAGLIQASVVLAPGGSIDDTRLLRDGTISIPTPPPGQASPIPMGAAMGNEVHDCQKLVIQTGSGERSFGPLVGVYPMAAALELNSAEAFQQRPVLVAEILKFGPATYLPLGLATGRSCLWMQWRGGQQWAAAILPSSTACAGQALPAITPTRWTVFESVASDTTRYPKTARWGWDDSSAAHYIGVKCANRWCAVGRRGFTPREPRLLQGPERRTIPGWFDSQHLAVRRGTTLVPGPWGVVTPARHLEELTMADWQGNLGVVAASIRISGRPGELTPYIQRFNLRMADGAATGRLWVRIGPSELDGVAEYRTAGSLSTLNRLIKRTPMVKHAAEGAVRWRWSDVDEEVWISCSAGCCHVE